MSPLAGWDHTGTGSYVVRVGVQLMQLRTLLGMEAMGMHIDGSGSYGFPTRPTTRRIPGPAQGLLEDTE